jgi:hypothetical protein
MLVSSLMELLANPLSRQKTAASSWLSRAGGNPANQKILRIAKSKQKHFNNFTGFPPSRE